MGHRRQPSDEDDSIFGKQRYEGAPDVHERFRKAKVTCQSRNIQPIENFGDVLEGKLYDQVRKNVQKAGWLTPLPIQAYGIPALLLDKDLIGCGETGSGKTLAYSLPVVLQMMKNEEDVVVTPNVGPQEPTAIIVAPTRELTTQIINELKKLTWRTNIKPVNLYGGRGQRRHQIRLLDEGCNVVVATMGRLWDFIDNNVISLRNCHYIVLDEADRMLDQGFEDKIRELFEHQDLPPQENRQVAMFSATFPDRLQKIARDFLTNRPRHEFITVGKLGLVNRDVKQEVLHVKQQEKNDVLLQKLEAIEETTEHQTKTIVFVNKKKTADFLENWLLGKDVNVSVISGRLAQNYRETVLNEFRRGEVNVLVATNVAARGLDVPMVDHVINYDLPDKGKFILTICFDVFVLCFKLIYRTI